MYSTGFAMTLVGLSLVTTLVIMAVTSNVVLSLGITSGRNSSNFTSSIISPGRSRTPMSDVLSSRKLLWYRVVRMQESKVTLTFPALYMYGRNIQ